MKVQAQVPETHDAGRAEAEQLFADIFQQYFKRVTSFVRSRLHASHVSAAEDLAQQTFVLLWTRYIAPGRLEEVDRPFGLLATIARGEIGSFYAIKSKTMGTPTDFDDPFNTPMLATGHAYLPETPDLVFLGRDLETAMTVMESASKEWREKDKVRGQLSRQINNSEGFRLGGLTPETVAQARMELAEAEQAEAQALLAFRDACHSVASLRSELERAAGPNWKSASGMPASTAGRRRGESGYTSNPEVTHCPEGHLLDRDNTYFYEDGTRSCRYCSAQRSLRYEQRKRAATSKRPLPPTTSVEVIEQARKMLTDPSCTLSIENIAKSLGIAGSTLYKRLPAETAARKSRRDVDPSILDAARAMLADPAHDKKTLQQIADAVGCSYQSVSRRLRPEVVARRARRKASRALAGAAR